MIGTVTHPGGTATLHEDRTWDVSPGPDADHVRALIGTLEPYGGPADGDFGTHMLSELADLLGGTYVLEPKEPPPPGTVY